MIVPSAVNLKMRFPEFAAVPDATVEFAIEEAARWVDDSWLPNDQILAILYLACHYMAIAAMAATSAGGQPIASTRMGEISVTYVTPPAIGEATSSDLLQTWYGRRFRDILHANFPPIAVI